MHLHRLICAAALLLLSSCAIVVESEKVSIGQTSGQHQIEGQIEMLTVVNRAGLVRVVEGTSNTVEVEVEVKLAEDRAAGFAGSLSFEDHVVLRREANAVIVEDAHRHDDDSEDWQVDLTIRAPGDVAVEVDLAAGEVLVELSTPRGVSIDCAAGEVSIRSKEVRGPLLVDLAAGEVDVEISDVAPVHDIEVDIAAGQVTLHLPPHSPAVFDLSVAAGDIQVHSSYGLEVHRGFAGASAEGPTGEGGPKVTVDMASGEIDLEVSRAPAAAH